MKPYSWTLMLATLGLGLGIFIGGAGLQGQQPVNAVPVNGRDPVSYRDIVKRVLPAVVSIESKVNLAKVKGTRKPRPSESFDDPRIPEEFRRFFEEFRRQAPDEESFSPRLGFGSGFLIDPKGVIVTNNHVVDGADQVVVQLQDGRKFTTKNIRGDKRTDLAVVMLEGEHSNLPFLELGDSDAMEIGDRVLAVGAPFGLAGTVTQGIVSAKGRNLRLNMYEDFLQTDAAINPGNSGGPLIALDGKVVGINSAIKSRTGGFQGVGLAITSNLAKNVVHKLRTVGVVQRGYLGVQIQDLDPDVAKRLNVSHGVLVSDLLDTSPAGKAGLKPGDIVTSINGLPVKDGRSLQTVVAGLPIGKGTPLEIQREGKSMTLTVVIEEQPNTFGVAGTVPGPRPQSRREESTSVGKIGIDLADLNEEMAEELGFRKNVQGVVITKVQSGTLASEAGLRRGMLIAKIDQKSVANAAAAQKALEAASLENGVLLQVQTPQGGTNFILLRQE